MSEVKWIKITTDMFDNRKIKAIRKLPEGNNVILIWVMLLSLAGRCNASGMIFLTENIPYTNKMLADELGFEESIICIALSTLERFGMISRDENMLISVNNWDEYQNVDGMERIREQTRKRVAEYRERKKACEIGCNNDYDTQKSNVLGCNKNGDITKTRDVINDVTSGKSEISRCNLECDTARNLYSASKTNAKNVDSVLYSFPEYKYILDNLELLECVRGWMEYKDEKKPRKSNHYDSERGIKTLLNKFIEYDKKYGTDMVIEAVNYAISNNYQGIVWDKIRNTAGNHTRSVYDEWRNA